MHRLLTGRSCVGAAAVSWLKYSYRDDETNERVDWIFSTVFVFKCRRLGTVGQDHRQRVPSMTFTF